MTENARHSTLSFDWGASTSYSADLRARELSDRVWWFITMRWIAAGVCTAFGVADLAGIVPGHIPVGFFIVAAVFLAVGNVVYCRITKRLLEPEIDRAGLRLLLIVEMIGDFVALSLLTYATGTIQTPLPMFFILHVVLATLFFSRRTSLVITVGAWMGGVMPLILEWLGVLPMISIFDSPFKPFVLKEPAAMSGYVFGFAACLFVSWYLVSEITTSLKLRESQLEDAYGMLSRLDREKSQATLRATHELKAPFAAIKSYVYTLRDGYCGPLPEKAQSVVTRIGERCDRLMEKITDIIHLSNLKTLVLTDMHFSPINLTKLVADEAAEAQLLADPQNIRVVNHAADEADVFVMGSAEYLHTLFSNLTRNAVHYSTAGAEVEITMRIKAKRVSVRVRDHGIGIPHENLGKIFDEHFRSNNAVAHHPNGTGLGLPMVKEIARLHGAVIQVSSELGKGSHFTVSFDSVEPNI